MMHSIIHLLSPRPRCDSNTNTSPRYATVAKSLTTRAKPTCAPTIINAKAQRVLDGSRHDLAWNSLGPIAIRQESMNDIEIEAGTVCTDQKLAAPEFDCQFRTRRRHSRHSNCVSHQESGRKPARSALHGTSCPSRFILSKTPSAERKPDATHPCICKASRRSCSARTAIPQPCGRAHAARIPPRSEARVPAERSDHISHI